MLFRRKNQVDDSTRINSVGRDEFRYTEDDHVLLFNAELMMDQPSRLIYASSIKGWLPPHDAEPISKARKEEILRKVCIYFEQNRESYVVVP